VVNRHRCLWHQSDQWLYFQSTWKNLVFPNPLFAFEGVRFHLKDSDKPRNPDQIAKQIITRFYLLNGCPFTFSKPGNVAARLQKFIPSGTSKKVKPVAFHTPSVSDADSATKIASAVCQNFTRRIVPLLRSIQQHQNPARIAHIPSMNCP